MTNLEIIRQKCENARIRVGTSWVLNIGGATIYARDNGETLVSNGFHLQDLTELRATELLAILKQRERVAS